MKQQLSIFLVFLLLLNSSIAVNIKNNILLTNHLTKAEKSNNFIDVKMLETCDEGILADVDTTNIYYNKISFPSRYLELPISSSIYQNIPQFNTPINIGENGKHMSRLTIRLVIPGMRITVVSNGSHHNYICKLFLDTQEIGSYFFQQNATYGDSIEEMIIYGTLFNIPPGLYIISLQCLNYGKIIFGTSQLNHQYIELFGEHAAGGVASTLPKNFLLPVKPNTISRKKTKFVFAVDDILTWIKVNEGLVTMGNYATAAEVDQCCNTKVFPILAAEGDTIQFRGSDRGAGLRGMRVSINYYNNLGYPEIYNTDYTNYSLDSLPDTTKNQANIATTKTPIENDNSYQPLDYSSSWIWNSLGNQSFAVATAVLPRRNTKSVMFIQACTHLLEVKVNDKVATINASDANKCERVQQLKSPTNMAVLKTGDKISIKMKKSTSTVANTNMKAYFKHDQKTAFNDPYNTGFIIAVIAYKNSAENVVEIKTGDPGWTCNSNAPSEVPIQSIYRNDFYLTAAFEARAIYTTGTEYTCNITLP